MEASVAGPAAAQGGDAGGQADGGPDLAGLESRVEGQIKSLGSEMRDALSDLATRFPTTEPGDGDGGDVTAEAFDMSFLDQPEVLQDPKALAEGLRTAVNAEAQRLMAAELGPIKEGMKQLADGRTEDRRNDELRSLVDEIPDLAREEVFKPVYEATQAMSQAYGWPEGLSEDPKMWRLVFLAEKTMSAVAEEGDADPVAAFLEGGGGARQAAIQRNSQDLGDAIFADNRKGASALPFGR